MGAKVFLRHHDGFGRAIDDSALDQEAFESFERFSDRIFAGGVTGAQETAAAGTECAARDEGQTFFRQQFLTERFVVHSGDFDAWEGVEGAARLEARQAKAVETVDDQPTPPVILLTHEFDIALAMLNGFQGSGLSHRGRGHDQILVKLVHGFGE